MVTLDSQQKKAVYAAEKSVMVLAGAGSGKTRVLIERVAHLIEHEHVSPYDIVCLTFTRKAAGEMTERLNERIGPAAFKVEIGTIHAFALKMLKRFGEEIYFRGKHITVYSQWEEDFLLRDEAGLMGIYDGRSWTPKKKEVDAAFKGYYETGFEPDPLDPAFKLFKSFIHRCKENNSVTYGGLLIGLNLLIPHLKKYLHIKHVLCDEVQDLDGLQWSIINSIVRTFDASLFVVGDVSQAIYEWRGGKPEYLIEHEHEFEVYRLETNYRSLSDIVGAANRLIENNELRLPLEMKPARGESYHDQIIHAPGVDSARLAQMLNQNFGSEPNLAVLCRIHAPLKKLSGILKESRIPHAYVGDKVALTNSEDFRRFHAFLKLVANPYDNFAFLLIRDLIGANDQYSVIRYKAAREGMSHFQWWYLNTVNLWVDWFRNANERTVYSNAVELCNLLQDDRYIKVLNFIKQWQGSQLPAVSISEYLQWLATYDISDEVSEAKEGLQLMTVHAAKGLQWPTVIIAGMNEGILPASMAIRNDEVEQERRLAYVAMTRAMDKLVFAIRPEKTTDSRGKEHVNPKSRFIDEALSENRTDAPEAAAS